MKNKSKIIAIVAVIFLAVIGFCILGQKMFAATDADLTKQAQKELTSGNPKQALVLVDKALKMNTKNQDAMVTLAQALCADKQYEKCINLCQSLEDAKALEGNQSLHQEMLVAAARACEGLGQYSSALATYQHADDIPVNNAKVQDGLGRMYYRSKKYDLAESAFFPLLKSEPQVAAHHAHYGQVLVAMGKQRAGLAELKKAYEMNPDDWDTQTAYAAALDQCNQTGEALKVLDKILAKHNTPDLVVFKQALQQKARSQGVNSGGQTLPAGKQNPFSKTTPFKSEAIPAPAASRAGWKSTQMWIDAVQSKLDSGDFTNCARIASVAIADDPTNPVFYRLRGDAQVKLKNVSDAIKDYDKAISLDPNDTLSKEHKEAARLLAGH